MLFRWFLVALALLGFQTVAAQELHVPAKLVAETQQPAPGNNVTLAFVFEPEPGWHGYWEIPVMRDWGCSWNGHYPKV